ncbi:MAG: tRNA (adenosine(37)-N6)-threonylcarbamoyltransferase complex ATPase subunit type 1 TsaE [Clostridiales bacterium]|nr:tRNA (adenosine(37)-N6)-threonylcarbamoyltransferase complex ATPase subunit type 1 TsaE [Clostridiales bacterium]
MRIDSLCEKETENAGRALAAFLRPGDIVALCGDLGAGKTAFVRGLADGLGCTEPITSPSFTIVNEHKAKLPLYHFDLYRLSCADELFDIGWDEYSQNGGICAVEWSENAPEVFGPETIRVFIEKTGENTRTIQIDIPGKEAGET